MVERGLCRHPTTQPLSPSQHLSPKSPGFPNVGPGGSQLQVPGEEGMQWASFCRWGEGKPMGETEWNEMALNLQHLKLEKQEEKTLPQISN